MSDQLVSVNPTLAEVHSVCKEALKVYDPFYAETFIASYISNRLPDDPIWIFFVGPPSSNKSLFMRCIEDLPDYKQMSKMTPNSLISGSPTYPGLITEINGKVLCFNDFGAILSMDTKDKLEIWGQIRELYDGKLSRAVGNKPPMEYNGIKVSLIANTTAAIDRERAIFAKLGSREIMYRLKKHTRSESKLTTRNLINYNTDDIKNAITSVLVPFIENLNPSQVFPISDELADWIDEVAYFVGVMRAPATYDQYTGEVAGFVDEEETPRLVKTFVKLYRCLKSLDPNYPDERAKQIILHIAISTSQPIRVRLLSVLCSVKDNPCVSYNEPQQWSTYELSKVIGIGEKACISQLATMSALGVVNMIQTNDRYRPEYKWEITKAGREIFSIISDYEGPEQ